MGNYKINSLTDNRIFVVTESYRKMVNKFKGIKESRGRIIHVVGAPGTGKSANIYHAVNELRLNVYDVEFTLKNVDTNSDDVFKEIYNHLKADLDANSKTEIYESLGNYDAVLFADKFHDSHLMEDGTIGFSVWTEYNGFKSFKFYLLCVSEYLKEINAFKGMNIILQTAWRVRFNGKKYDLFTDMGFLSRILVALMGIFFEVVEISYSKQETIKIVKEHVDADEKIIMQYIDKYGNKPRLVCQAITK